VYIVRKNFDREWNVEITDRLARLVHPAGLRRPSVVRCRVGSTGTLK
jgi:hypothetical protein